MFDWIQKLFIGHIHKYTILETIKGTTYQNDWSDCTTAFDSPTKNRLVSITRYVCRCEHCGKIKYYDC
jgi:hypothetical protein